MKLLAGFGMNPPLVYDPFAPPEVVEAHGARAVGLDAAPGRGRFRLDPLPAHRTDAKPHRSPRARPHEAGLVSDQYRSGGIVDEAALAEALTRRQIAGAALDCFAEEPLTAPPVLAGFDNVLLAPHCIAWTNEMFRDIGRTACQSIVDLAAGTTPRGVVNPEVFNRPGFVEKWRRLSARVL